MSGHRTKLKRSRDLAEIARLRLRGQSQARIGEALGLSQSQVSRSLAKLEKQWLEDPGLDPRLARAIDLEALRMVNAQLWQAFLVSKEPRKVLRTVHREGSNPYTSTSTRTDKRVGSAVLLGLILDCARLQSELQGLYATKDARTDWRKERIRELREQGKPLESVQLEVILVELMRRNGIIDIWAWGPAPPRPDQLPPGFRPPVYPKAPPRDMA